jgi:hypothetical protein
MWWEANNRGFQPSMYVKFLYIRLCSLLTLFVVNPRCTPHEAIKSFNTVEIGWNCSILDVDELEKILCWVLGPVALVALATRAVFAFIPVVKFSQLINLLEDINKHQWNQQTRSIHVFSSIETKIPERLGTYLDASWTNSLKQSSLWLKSIKHSNFVPDNR